MPKAVAKSQVFEYEEHDGSLDAAKGIAHAVKSRFPGLGVEIDPEELVVYVTYVDGTEYFKVRPGDVLINSKRKLISRRAEVFYKTYQAVSDD
jgi:hypothetical protein